MPPLSRVVSGSWRGATTEFRDDRLLVSVRRGAPVDATLDAVSAVLATRVEGLRIIHPSERPWAVFEFEPLPDADTRIPQIAAELGARPDLRYAEPDFICRGRSFVPSDPLHSQQWWPEHVGLNELWPVTRGNAHVLLGVVDTGISMVWGADGSNHEDLQGTRYIVRHLIPMGEDRHNYVPGQSAMVPRDGHGHGTHVTGILAANGNNHVGVTGVNWISPVYVARVLDDFKEGSATTVKLGVDHICRFAGIPPFTNWALFNLGLFMGNGTRVVVNLSLGFQTPFDALLEMCEETAGGSMILCVATESMFDSDTEIDFPAAHAAHFDHVIAVGSTNDHDEVKRPLLENYAAITLFAPGEHIMSTRPPYPCHGYPSNFNSYADDSGTSQACAIVSGAVSLMWGMNRRLRPIDIRNFLISNAGVAHDRGRRYPRLDLRRLAATRPRPSRIPWI